MKHLFLFSIFSLYSSLLSFAIQPNTKFCIDCKFYKNNLFTSSEYGKCSLFSYDVNDYFLVNGNSNDKKNYKYCSVSRNYDHMCGKEGTFYEKK